MYEEQADGKKVNKMHYTMNTIALAKNTYNPKNSCVIHEDGSCRLQIIDSRNNKLFFTLLTKLEEKYAIQGLVNTSFNVNGQPNCEDLQDAIELSNGIRFYVHRRKIPNIEIICR